MLHVSIVITAALGYVALLFAIAYFGEKRADRGRSIIANPYVYALSMAVYCTAWTFYGSVGRAATGGVGFLPVYIGPTLAATLWLLVLRKMIRISKANRITSIADFVASRYGKSSALGALVAFIAVVGVVPYIALQLKAVTTSFKLLGMHTDFDRVAELGRMLTLQDTSFWVAMLLASFAILFGTRHLDVTEHHEGMVAAIAFESIVKLVAFLAVGIWVTFYLHDGFGELFERVSERPELSSLLVMGRDPGAYLDWFGMVFLSSLAIFLLPRQFQMNVVENVDEDHLGKACWLFPLYLLAINIFVLPIAFAGRLRFASGAVDADTFVLTLPMAEGQPALALLVFIGGFSAATGMVIVASVALSTMVSNNLVMPALLRLRALRLTGVAQSDDWDSDLSGFLLAIRRLAIVFILVLSYLFVHLTTASVPLVSIGLVSFAAVAQFAPAIFGGMYWKGATRLGALVGLFLGFLVWAYTLPLPLLLESGWLSRGILDSGAFGIEALNPYALFGLQGLDPITHSLFYSLLANTGVYVGLSLFSKPNAMEHNQARLFVEAFEMQPGSPALWRGTASVQSLRSLLERFLGMRRTERFLSSYAASRGLDPSLSGSADADLVDYCERLLSGAIGNASARVAMASVVHEEPLSTVEVMEILDETSLILAERRKLDEKSRALEEASRQLHAANLRLQELDRLKDDFISTVTHELRTPLTSIRAFSEILLHNPDLEAERRREFQGIVLKESERLSRLIGEVLDLSKIESGTLEWHAIEVDMREVVEESLATTSRLFEERDILVEVDLGEKLPWIVVDRDRVVQIVLNLLSNAIKFCDPESGRIRVSLGCEPGEMRLVVSDNGPGISAADRNAIFEKFHQVEDASRGKPRGTGLGLSISRRIASHFGGRMWVESEPGHGSSFFLTLPLQEERSWALGAETETASS